MECANNQVKLVGKITSDFSFSHEILGEKFYLVSAITERSSGTNDKIQLIVSNRLIDTTKDYTNENVYIKGQFRSYNKNDGDKRHLMLTVFVDEIEFTTNDKSFNEITLNGYVCKKPLYRETPLGRKITDVILAVNRSYGKSDYLPCVVWGRSAKFASNFDIGANISLTGRIQSRDYEKKYNDHSETHTAYEVSVNEIKYLDK